MTQNAVQDFIDQVKDASDDMASMSDVELFELLGSANSYDFQRLTDAVTNMEDGPVKTAFQQALARELDEGAPMQIDGADVSPMERGTSKHPGDIA